MFISKRAFNEAINKAVRETEEKAWRAYDEDMLRRQREDIWIKFENRLQKVEECCGLVEPKATCPCGMTVPTPKYR